MRERRKMLIAPLPHPPVRWTLLNGHVDFYGRCATASGWVFCGWASRWPWDGPHDKVIARFADADFDGDHAIGFFDRADVAAPDRGFILFLDETLPAEASQLRSLEFSCGGERFILLLDSPPPRLIAPDLQTALFSLRERASLAGEESDVDVIRALLQSAWREHQIEFLRALTLLDEEFYLEQMPIVDGRLDLYEHFHDIGARDGRKPNLYFEPRWYLQQNPDVVSSRLNPLYHYAKWGDFEGRKPSVGFDPQLYRQKYGLGSEVCALAHWVEHRDSPRFDSATYRSPRAEAEERKPAQEGRRNASVTAHRGGPKARPQNQEVQQVFTHVMSSPFVDDVLCRTMLGASKADVEAAELYVRLPPSGRPQISCFIDKTYYLERYPDLASSETLDALIHFISRGCAEGRSPHPLIDQAHIRSSDPFVLPANPSPAELWDALKYDLADPSPYFQIEEYRRQLPDSERQLEGCLEHYLKSGSLLGLRPNMLFDPVWYFRQLDGAGDVNAGVRHFVLFGDREGRSPSLDFDAKRYLELNPDVAAAGIPPLVHYLRSGRSEGRRTVRLASGSERPHTAASSEGASSFDPAAAVSAYRRIQENIVQQHQSRKELVDVSPIDAVSYDDPEAEIRHLRFPRVRAPQVSILIPVFNELKYTVECLASIIRSQPAISYEVILADDASTDPAIGRLAKIKNLKLVRQRQNLGFLENCNAAFRSCRGNYLLLLNNDAQLMPGSLDALVGVLESDQEIAAVGPKILYPNGRLQEAGCTLDRDGISTMVGLFADPSEPCFGYDRDVHYSSGAALLVRRSEVGESLFDPVFKPAYCEDADLCLRLLSRRRRVRYCHQAEVVHHLTVSIDKDSAARRLQRVRRNQQKLTEKWSALLEELNTARVIAIYLPQYHTTPENDFHWGQGFTEWSNVAKAEPAYLGHYQPHLPADLGFYDLRVKQTVERQAALARRYGVAGFCVYYYNFGDRRALDQAFEAVVADPSIDFPYCVCWANENWTRHWDGGSREIIFEQRYDSATLLKVVEDVTRYAADPRYLRVNGKPLFLVYRPLLIEDVRNFTDRLREGFRRAGFDGVHLVYFESMETAERAPPPVDLGFDASVEFPPHGYAVPVTEEAPHLRDGFVGQQFDYEGTLMRHLHRPLAGYKRYPAVFPSWDNTPRQPLRGDSFVRATPEAFQVYLEEKLERLRQFFVGEERLLFVNAWNEWAEGTHLEPDMRYGHRWLEAIHNALMAKSLL